MKLSIIVPVYNALPYLTKNLEQLHSIKSDEIEFIIVNDGSTDNSYNECLKYKYVDSRFIIHTKKNGGVSSARNYGIKYARGKYIMFLDGDDYISTHAIKNIIEYIKQDLDFIIFKRFYITRNCEEFKYDLTLNLFRHIKGELYHIEEKELLLQYKCFCSGSGEVILKRSLIKDIIFDTNKNLMEDFDFFMKVLANKSIQIYFSDEILTFINDEVPNSLTRKKVSYSNLHPGTLLKNPFLINKKKLLKHFFWLEIYFHMKKMDYFNRIKYTLKNRHILAKYVYINKYTIGVLYFLLGIDINKFKILIYKIIKKWN